MYFSEHKGEVEIDEKGHTDRKQNEENERRIKIEKHPDCNFFHRINPDAEGFDIFFEISKIPNYITQSNKEKIKEQENKMKKQKRRFAKQLLSYTSSISMPFAHCKYEKTTIKNKTIKLGKQPGTKHYLGRKDVTLNFRPQKINQTVLFVRQISQDF